MQRYVLDTNLYIRADRDSAWAEGLERFVSAYLPWIHFHGVVAEELLAGAIDRRREKLVTESLISPFEKRGRVVSPTFAAWARAGRIVSRLTQRRLLSRGGVKASFLNDCVLAASCRQEGLTVITLNRADFELIRKEEPVDVVSPWPT